MRDREPAWAKRIYVLSDLNKPRAKKWPDIYRPKIIETWRVTFEAHPDLLMNLVDGLILGQINQVNHDLSHPAAT
jgi:hypothetical protein